MSRYTRSGRSTLHIRQKIEDIESRGKIEIDQDDSKCIVGCGRKKDTILLPCRHQHTCEMCWFVWKVKQMKEASSDNTDEVPKCPVCREVVDEEISVFN